MSVTEGTQAEAAAGRSRARTVPMSTRLRRFVYSTQRWPWLLLTVIVVLGFYEIGLRLSPYGTWSSFVSPYWTMSAVYAGSFGALVMGLGSYDRDRRFDYFDILRTAVVTTVLASLINLAFHYFTFYAVVGRLTLVFGAASAILGILAVRLVITWAVRQRPYRFTVAGNAAAVQKAMSDWVRHEHQARMYRLVPWQTIVKDHGRPTVEGLVEADVAEIVVTPDALTDQEAIEIALMSIQADVSVVDDQTFYSHLFERLPLDDVSKRWILEQGLARPQAAVVAMKRLADIVGAAVGLVTLSPIIALIALAVRVTSPGPILFVQTRQGRFFRPFRMLKFRTMRAGGDPLTGFTKIGDDRVTRLGRILRRTHLDELPQLLNVLRGEMSLVGPRPETLEFAQRMDAELPLYELRYLVRPGLTGHAQLKQGYAMDSVLDTRTKLSYDLYYLCNYSMRMDIRLLLRTALFLIRGAR